MLAVLCFFPAFIKSLPTWGDPCLIIQVMIRRAILILLMLVLPIQASWAVAVGFCQHEQGVAASHFGHHDHQHDDASGDDVSGKYSSQVDRDCGYHHQASPHWLAVLPQLPHVYISAQNLNPTTQLYLSEAIAARPERPNWHFAT